MEIIPLEVRLDSHMELQLKEACFSIITMHTIPHILSFSPFLWHPFNDFTFRLLKQSTLPNPILYNYKHIKRTLL